MNTAPFFLAGPTAVGKSAVALLLAERLGGEIISVDSMQVYRGLDIGTAKPTPAERARVPHHLIDVVELNEPFDAACFVRHAQAAVADIQARGRVPIFCGGTGLYFRAYLEGLGEAPPSDAKLRAELEATPLAELLRELEQLDPETFTRIDQKNPRRVVRALEVIRLTGKPFSAQRAEWRSEGGRQKAEGGSQENSGAVRPHPNPLPLGEGGSSTVHLPSPAFLLTEPKSQPASFAERRESILPLPSGEGRGEGKTAPIFCLTRPTEDLIRRIEARVDEMFARGLVEETRGLLTRGLTENRTAMQAIGYRQVVEHLRGERGLAETIELVKIRTRQFAKRQMTWFRGQTSAQWLELGVEESTAAIADRVLRSISA